MGCALNPERLRTQEKFSDLQNAFPSLVSIVLQMKPTTLSHEKQLDSIGLEMAELHKDDKPASMEITSPASAPTEAKLGCFSMLNDPVPFVARRRHFCAECSVMHEGAKTCIQSRKRQGLWEFREVRA